MPITAREFDRVMRKFGFRTRRSGDLIAWLEIDGRQVVWTKRSHKGSGDLPHYHDIRQQLYLNESQLRDAINCPLDREGYLEILGRRGII